MNLLVEFQYFPNVNLYKDLTKVSNIVFEQYEYYQKMSFRNRCRIAGAEGIIDLSIPLEGGRDQRTPIREVRVSGAENWQQNHWRTIQSCYSRSPWFEFYRDDLGTLFAKPAVWLADWNLACFEWAAGVLSLDVGVVMTDAWRPEYPADEWLDCRGAWRPSDGPARKGSVGGRQEWAGGDKSLEGMFAVWESPLYRQVFQERTGFIPGLSILDLIFCEGRAAKSILAGENLAGMP